MRQVGIEPGRKRRLQRHGHLGRVDADLAALHQAVETLTQAHERLVLADGRRLDGRPRQLLDIGQPEAARAIFIRLEARLRE